MKKCDVEFSLVPCLFYLEVASSDECTTSCESYPQLFWQDLQCVETELLMLIMKLQHAYVH